MGTELVLKDDTVMWLQVLYPFEIEEAPPAAQVAMARLVMALQQHGGGEMNFVDAALWEDGPDGARARIVDAKAGTVLVEVINALRVAPEWTERIQITDRTDAATEPLEEAERELLASVTKDYVAEVERRIQTEGEYLKQRYSSYDGDALREEYQRLYIEPRGADIANRSSGSTRSSTGRGSAKPHGPTGTGTTPGARATSCRCMRPRPRCGHCLRT